jgi:hypothetical protein
VGAIQIRSLLCQTMRGALITMACVVGIVQWTVGRHFLTSSIFDHRHETLSHSFGEFRSALQSEVLRQCATGRIRHIYFDDLEVGLPYIVNSTLDNPSCQLARTTPVTPLDPDARASCSAITIMEKHLSWWVPGIVQSDLGAATPRVTLIRKWETEDGSYGFDVYRGRACGEMAGDVSK